MVLKQTHEPQHELSIFYNKENTQENPNFLNHT